MERASCAGVSRFPDAASWRVGPVRWPAMERSFDGFGPDAFAWFEGLARDNTRAYFGATRAAYEASVRGPLEALLVELQPEFGGEVRLMRQQRDLRFSRDRTPYKERTAGFLQARPGGSLYAELSARGFYAGRGYKGLMPDQLERYRAAVADDVAGAELAGLVAAAEAGGLEVWGEVLKTAPRGFPRDHPRVALLRHKLMIFGTRLAPGPIGRVAALEHAAGAWRAGEPLAAWLDAHVGPSTLAAAGALTPPPSVRPRCEHVFVSVAAEILHADLDAFYASVEQRDDPRLRGKPVVVGGGVVLAASYEAKARGVKTAMGGRQWRRLCPDAIVVSPRMSAYSEASKAVFEIFRDTTPLVEGLSIDEAFLDVRGLRRIAGTPEEIAVRLRARVLDEVGLPITVGVARTKFLAKVASGVAKPDGLLVVPPDGELDFLHPLPVERLWGVGPKTGAKLHARGIHTVGEVAQLAEATLVKLLGRASGRQLHALSHNRDPRRVDTRRRRRSIGAQRALGRGARTPAELEVMLVGLVDKLARRLRGARRVCRTVTLRLRFDDFERATRSHTLPEATARTEAILVVARELLAAALPLIRRRGITLIGLTLGSLTDDRAVQLALPVEPRRGRPRPKRAPPPGPDPPLRAGASPDGPDADPRASPDSPRAPRAPARPPARTAGPAASAAGATPTRGSRRGSTPPPRSRRGRRTTPTSTWRPRRRSTRRWTHCATASARPRSRAPCCSGATRGSRCRCFRTDPCRGAGPNIGH